MEYGLIKDTTMTALADSLRAKGIVPEGERVPAEVVESVKYKSSNATSLDDPTPTERLAVQQELIISIPEATSLDLVFTYSRDPLPEGVYSGTYSVTSFSTTDDWPLSLSNITLTAEGPLVHTRRHTNNILKIRFKEYSGAPAASAFILEVFPLDANGNRMQIVTDYEVVTNTITPTEMVEAINDFQILDAEVYQSLLDRSIEKVEAKDFGDITSIGPYTFAYCRALIEAEFPDTIETFGEYVFYQNALLKSVTMPKNIKSLAGYVFTGSTMLKTLTFYRTPPTIVEPTFNGAGITTIYVPGEGYDDYLAAPYWGTTYRDLLKVNSKYAGKPSNKILVFNETASVSIPLTNYDSHPVDVHVTSDNACVSIDNIVASNTEVTFDIQAGQIEDIANITIEIPGDNGHIFVRTMQVAVYAELTPSTYEVVPVEGASYGFELTDDGFYTSTNQKVPSSASICRVNISNMMGLKMYVDGISYGESNYDYGILSSMNVEFSTDAKLDTTGVYFTYKGLSSPNVRAVEYTDAIGDCFIYIKFIKDTSGDNYDDSFKFKIRFEGEE